jgi:hypothetical protein
LSFYGTLIVLVSVLLAFLVLSSILPPAYPDSMTLVKAGNASYAMGSSLNGTFTLQHSAVLSGAFVTNASAKVRIQQSNWQSHVDECQKATNYCYNTGNVNHATLNATLVAGSYHLTVTFTNETTVQTWFNVTQGFVATYQK